MIAKYDLPIATILDRTALSPSQHYDIMNVFDGLFSNNQSSQPQQAVTGLEDPPPQRSRDVFKYDKTTSPAPEEVVQAVAFVPDELRQEEPMQDVPIHQEEDDDEEQPARINDEVIQSQKAAAAAKSNGGASTAASTTQGSLADSQAPAKKYCGGRCSGCTLTFIILGVLALIAVPIALVMKNDVFTPSNGSAERGTCQSPRCLRDSDCSLDVLQNSTSSNKCFLLRCAGERELVENFCPCLRDSDCRTGRCEGFSVGLSTCAPLLPDGSFCNEATDCASGRCDKPTAREAPVCVPTIADFSCTAICNEDTDCESGNCNLLAGRCVAPRRELQEEATEITNDNSTIVPSDNGCTCWSKGDCGSGRCDFRTNNPADGRVCRDKAPSCGGCNEDSDCMSGDCNLKVFRCRNENGKMDDRCNCLNNPDCESNRCEAVSLNPLDGFFCFPKNEDCRPCNEDSDCINGKCNLVNFMCGDGTGNILNCWQQ